MKTASDIIASLPAIPIEHLVVIVALASIALAAWAIHAVTSIIRKEKEK